jgi:hypothetical protein
LVIYSKYGLWEAKYRSGRVNHGIYRKIQEKYRLKMCPRGL